MLIGQSLLAPTVAVDQYSPWFPRGGNTGTIVVEVLLISSGSCKVTISMEQKDADESDAAATAVGSSVALTAVGTQTAALGSAGVKQMVRCKINMASTGANVEWAHVRINPPLWQPN